MGQPSITSTSLSCRCPSSVLEEMLPIGQVFRYQMPSYVGVSGAAANTQTGDPFTESDLAEFLACDGEKARMSWGGMLVANATRRLGDALDGTLNVLLIAEIVLSDS